MKIVKSPKVKNNEKIAYRVVAIQTIVNCVKGFVAKETERKNNLRLPRQGCEAYVRTSVYEDRTGYITNMVERGRTSRTFPRGARATPSEPSSTSIVIEDECQFDHAI